MQDRKETKNLNYSHLEPLSSQFKHKFVNRAIDAGVYKLKARKAKSTLRNAGAALNNLNFNGFWNSEAIKNNFVVS